jgi:hypothetical protein
MLQRISSAELTEWMAYFKLREEPEPPKPKASEVLRAVFANRVQKKRAT